MAPKFTPASLPPAKAASADELEFIFRPDPCIHDGRFANNGWLQELPRPQSKLTWDNAAYLSPATAIRLGLAPAGHPEQANEKVVALSNLGGPTVHAPVWVLPGHADNSVTVHLGHGRSHAGRAQHEHQRRTCHRPTLRVPRRPCQLSYNVPRLTLRRPEVFPCPTRCG